MQRTTRLAGGIVLACLAASAAMAGDGTLDKMKSTGEIRIGFRVDQFPFAYEAAERQPVGYTLDLCRGIVGLLQKEFAIGPVEFRLVPLSPGNRVAMVANGSVDMECDLSTDNAGREAQVSFLDPTFVGSTKILVRVGSGPASVADMAGKRLVVVAGSSNVQVAMKLSAERGLKLKVLPVKDDKEATRMLEAGTADGFMSSDVLLYGAVVRTAEPAGYRILDEPLTKRTYAIMVRREDAAFRDAANRALRTMIRSGAFEEIYQRWFQSPVAPAGLNLKLPMSEELRGRVVAAKAAPG